MMSKMKCFGLFAGCALASGALYADPTYSQGFEGSLDLPANWTGGEVKASNYTYTVTGSTTPLTGAHNNVLVIEGNAGYTHTGTTLSGKPTVDMMVQTARPDDELGFPSSEDTTTIQIAVAVDSNGCFNAYCKNKSNTVGWYKLSNTPYDQAGWARVSFLFDYSNNRCQIRIDGQPVMSEYGYLTAAGDIAGNGAWYTLAKANSSSVASMKVIGCTAIDDVVMNVASDYTYPLAENAATNGVPCAWFDQYGVAWEPDTQFDASGMTAAQKYNACLSPIDGQTFAVKSITVEKVNNVEKATVAIPVFVSTTGRKVMLDYGTNKDSLSESVLVTPGESSVSITIPNGENVVYYRLRATDNN